MSVKNFSRLAILGTIFWMSSAMAIVFPGPGEDQPIIPLPGYPPPKIQMSSAADVAIQFPGAPGGEDPTPNPGPGPGQDPTPRMQLASSANSNSEALLVVVQQLSPEDKQVFLEALLADPDNGNAAADILAKIESQYR